MRAFPRSVRSRRPVVVSAVAASLISLAVPAVRAASEVRPFIINGEDADARRYPFMVSLQLKGSEAPVDRHFCGGTLIDPEWVLTAAHCADAVAPALMTAVVGANRLSDDGGEHRDVVEAVTDPAWDSESLVGDAALLRLAEPVEGVRTIEPVRWSERALWEAGDVATTVGWGVTRTDSNVATDDLQFLELPIVADSIMTSEKVYAENFQPLSMLGAGPIEGGAGSCFGDSGGPLMVGEGRGIRQIGVVSWGRECAGLNSPGVYARVGEGTVRNFVDSYIPLRVADVGTAEDGVATFTVSLGRRSTLPVTAAFSTVSITATPGSDFEPAIGRLVIEAGQREATVEVPVVSDGAPERDETFRLVLSNVSNAYADDVSGTATILDDDIAG